MKWFWDKRYAVICIYVIGTFVIIYILKLVLDGAAYFLSVIPEFFQGIGAFFGRLSEIFAPLIIALIIAYLLDPVVDFFQRVFDKLSTEKMSKFKSKRAKNAPCKNRTAGTALTYLTLFLIIGLLIWGLINKLNLKDDYLSGITAEMDKTKNQFSETYASIQIRLREMGLLENLEKYLDRIINGIGLIIQRTADSALMYVSSAGGNIFNALMGIIMAFYILSGKERIFKRMRELSALFLPYRARTGTRRVLGDIHGVFSGYIRGQLTDALIMAILISVLLSIIDVDFAVIIGILTGLLNIIPYFGAFIGFLLSVTVALLSGDYLKALYTAIGVLILQQIDGVYINPKVVGKNLELSPLLVIVALSAGGSLFGMPGMILAVPVCAVLKMFLMRYVEYRKEKTEKPHVE